MVGDNLEWEVVTPRRRGKKGIWIVDEPNVLDGRWRCC
jgi:FMN phosphatase YigB (HAD superfamily)